MTARTGSQTNFQVSVFFCLDYVVLLPPSLSIRHHAILTLNICFLLMIHHEGGCVYTAHSVNLPH